MKHRPKFGWVFATLGWSFSAWCRSGWRSACMTISVVCQIAWVASGIVGALAGAVIPTGVEGFDFALTALFAVLAFEAFQASHDLSAPLIAGGLALAAAVVLPGQVIIVALVSYFLVLLLLRFWAPRVDDRLTWRLP